MTELKGFIRQMQLKTKRRRWDHKKLITLKFPRANVPTLDSEKFKGTTL